MKTKKQKFNDVEWLRQKAAIEDKSLVSVGGLVTDLAKADQEKRWDVLIIEDATRKVESVAGTNLPEKGSFHTVGKRLDTVSGRLNDAYSAVAVPALQFNKGDVLPKDVEEYEGD